MNEIKLYKSSLYTFFLSLVCFIFVIAGILMVVKDSSFIAWFTLVFSILGMFIVLVFLFDKKPQLIINKKGIWYKKAIWKKHNPNEIIKWETIKEIYWASINNQKLICLKTTSSETKKQSAIQKLNKSMGFQDTNIPVSMIKIDVNKLVDFLGSMIVSEDSKREHLIQNFIISPPPSFFSKVKSKFKS